MRCSVIGALSYREQGHGRILGKDCQVSQEKLPGTWKVETERVGVELVALEEGPLCLCQSRPQDLALAVPPSCLFHWVPAASPPCGEVCGQARLYWSHEFQVIHSYKGPQ